MIRFKRLENGKDIELPSYASDEAAGMDIRAAEDVHIPAGTRAMVKTGLAMSIPFGYEMQVRPRSGLAAKHGITIVNSPGTIDSDYRGEICIILHNLGDLAFQVSHGDRIAQLVLAMTPRLCVEEVDELSDTTRGAGGFGSTGRK